MDAIEIPDWETFELKLKELRAELSAGASTLLFRGLGDSELRLTTTLERAGYEGMSFSDYYSLLVRNIRPAVESFTEEDWPEYSDEIEMSFRDRELLSLHRFPPQALYRYMIYLRHHGFPSPLLDWSKSPYVAAFFAFRNPLGKPEKRSIYAYCEMPRGLKGGAVGAPTIHPIGPYVRGHRRHFRQQSDYTICGSFDQRSWSFYSHDRVFTDANARRDQDALWKFNLPSTERTKVLGLLNEYNLNAFSLFDTEETLLETMWFRESILR